MSKKMIVLPNGDAIRADIIMDVRVRLPRPADIVIGEIKPGVVVDFGFPGLVNHSCNDCGDADEAISLRDKILESMAR